MRRHNKWVTQTVITLLNVYGKPNLCLQHQTRLGMGVLYKLWLLRDSVMHRSGM